MQTTHYFSFPTNITFGFGVIKLLPQYLIEKKCMKPLIVTDPQLRNLSLTKNLTQLLQNHNIEPVLFSDLAKNPVKKNVNSGVQQFKDNSCDCIIGFGGGVAMDVARAIALMVNHPGDLFRYEDALGGDELVTEKIPLFITIPTTSGTGSEVGRSTVISDDDTHAKKIIFSQRLIASQVFADPLLTFELPPHITAATGMDALTHHIESYLAKGFHPLCDGIALEGVRLIAENLQTAVNKPTPEARSNMMMAALMGAVAFQKGLGVVHSTAHALSTHVDLHHGLANAIMLPHGLAFNAEVAQSRFQNLAQALKLKSDKKDALVNFIHDLTQEIGLPQQLSSQGVSESAIANLADTAFHDGCHQNNPRPVSYDDFVYLFKEAL